MTAGREHHSTRKCNFPRRLIPAAQPGRAGDLRDFHFGHALIVRDQNRLMKRLNWRSIKMMRFIFRSAIEPQGAEFLPSLVKPQLFRSKTHPKSTALPMTATPWHALSRVSESGSNLSVDGSRRQGTGPLAAWAGPVGFRLNWLLDFIRPEAQPREPRLTAQNLFPGGKEPRWISDSTVD